MAKRVFGFKDADLDIVKLGNKGAQLASMTQGGLPVPPGFTITTEACKEYYDSEKRFPEKLMDEITDAILKLEDETGKGFGSKEKPLLLSVRSGSYVSMPGMMDTILNLGLTDEIVEGLAKKMDDRRAALDSYRRFLQMFGDVVLGVEHELFEKALEALRKKAGVKFDHELKADALADLVKEYKALIKKHSEKTLPDDPIQQLKMSVEAVFESWNNKRAIAYRKINRLRDDAYTAVNVQAMVFGNTGMDSGTGVGFTRNPSTGQKEMYGEYLVNAQGEDVVAGIRTPKPLSKLDEDLPKAYKELQEITQKLEETYKDMQDFEFTVENGHLYMLQTRTGKRTAAASLKIALDMVDEKLIDDDEAILRIKPEQIDTLMHKQLDDSTKDPKKLLGKGLPASPGGAVGKIIFSPEKVVELKAKGEDVILVRTETSPEDIEGMHASNGILTARGGMTSHAAVVARGMGKACIVGAEDIKISYEKKQLVASGKTLKEGDFISMDGTAGEVYEGKMALKDPNVNKDFKKILSWCDDRRKIGVRTNADTPHDSVKAVEFGAEGIGLCRTEHMFFEGDRIKAVREMIIAKTEEDRVKAINKLLPFQKKDFIGIFEAMDNKPVTIRLLDPPLHEFLPHEDKDVMTVAKELGVKYEDLKSRISELAEVNPMLGHRGCRLLITYPEITKMQTRAILEAAVVSKKNNVTVMPEIMIPLVGHINEYNRISDVIKETAKEVFGDSGDTVEFKIGTMIETPRGALVSDTIAGEAEFFSFGTNDLTQMTFGFSRDDVGKFVPVYIDQGILQDDPFQTLDIEGVGQLVASCVDKSRKVNPDIKLGICGEHGGDPRSIEFCYERGLDYVSCSPFRVPIARLVAAQASIREKK